MSVKKTDKSTKTKAGSSKTERSHALKTKGKAAAPRVAAKKKSSAPARGRPVAAKPASKKVVAAKPKAATKTASRARSAATRQRTVAAPVASRSTARAAKKPVLTSKSKTAAASRATATAKKSAAKTAKTKSPSKSQQVSAKKAPTSKSKAIAATPARKAIRPPAKSVKPPVKKDEGTTAKLVQAVATTAEKALATIKRVAETAKNAVLPSEPEQTTAPKQKSAVAKPAATQPAPSAPATKHTATQDVQTPGAETKSAAVSSNLAATKATATVASSGPGESVAAALKKAAEKTMIGKAVKTSVTEGTESNLQEADSKSVPVKPSEAKPGAKPVSKPVGSGRQGFKVMEFIVYPAHGVGQIIAVEEQEVAGFKLELFVISFIKDKMILKVPTTKVVSVGMRKLAEADVVKKALDTLTGRARVKRTMWSRRAQEYEAKINSGDLGAIAEVVRDLYRSDAQPEQSYSERQLYEAAIERLSREVGTVQKLTETESLKLIETQLQKGPRRSKAEEADAESDAAATEDGEIEEAA